MKRISELNRTIEKCLSLVIVTTMIIGQFWSFAFAEDVESAESIETNQVSQKETSVSEEDGTGSEITTEKSQDDESVENSELPDIENRGTIKGFSEEGIVEAEPVLLEHAVRGLTEDGKTWITETVEYENRGQGNIYWFTNDIEADSFSISTAEELEGLSDITNGQTVKIKITISKTKDQEPVETGREYEAFIYDFENKTINISKNIKYEKAWKGLGKNRKPFRGEINGGNFEIEFSADKQSDEEYAGFVSYASGANISNLMLKDINVKGSRYAGAVVAYGAGTVIKHVAVVGNVEGEGKIGAIAGQLDGASSISNVFFYKEGADLKIGDAPIIERAYIPGEPDTSKPEILSAESFKSGEAAYLLDIEKDGSRAKCWTQGTSYPVLTREDNQSYYQISVESAEHGSINVPKYVKVGEEVSPTITAAEGYILKQLTIKTAEKTKYDYGSSIKFSMPAANVELKAEFMSKPAEAQYTVTFVLNGGKLQGHTGDIAEYPITVNVGEKVEAPQLTKVVQEAGKDVNYVLVGWYEDETFKKLHNFNSAVFKALKLYAKWAKEGEVTVSFDLGQAKGVDGMTPISPAIVKKGKVIPKPVVPEWAGKSEDLVDGIYLKQNRVTGWTLTENPGADEPYFDLSKSLPLDFEGSELTLYAQWKETDYFDTGTETEPCKIPTLNVLKALRDKVNNGKSYKDKYFVLSADIEFPTNERWTPIGKRTRIANQSSKPFEGNFNGGTHSFKNLIIDKPAEDYQGLFGFVQNGTLKNISIENAAIKSYKYSGILAGCIGENTVVDGCHVKLGSIGGKAAIGGLIGMADAEHGNITIKNCTNSAGAKAEGAKIANDYSESCGGIVGLTSNEIRMSDSNNNHYQTTEFEMLIEGCENMGAIQGKANVGGIVGKNKRTKLNISACDNRGNIASGTTDTAIENSFNRGDGGGIIGEGESERNFPVTISTSKNSGEISSYGNAGGIVGSGCYSAKKGSNGYIKILNCENGGRIISLKKTGGLSRLGGIAGSMEGTGAEIKDCVNSGNIVPFDEQVYVGGIVGSIGEHARIIGCRNTETGDIVGNSGNAAASFVGGIAGSIGNNLDTMENCTNLGDIYAKGANVGGIAGSLTGSEQKKEIIHSLVNSGNITVYGNDFKAANRAGEGIGGIFGLAGTSYNRLELLSNTGKITVNLKNAKVAIGGIAGKFGKYTQTKNSYNVGKIEVNGDAEITGIGGISGFNEEENNVYQISCYNIGDIGESPQVLKKKIGQISGINAGKNKNCFYKNDADTDDGGKTAQQFVNGEVAYLLDNQKGEHRTYNWSQGSSYPIFNTGVAEVYGYKVEPANNGSLTPLTGFQKAGSKIIFAINADLGYMLSRAKVLGQDGKQYTVNIDTVNNHLWFIMPQTNVKLMPEFSAISTGGGIIGTTSFTVTFDPQNSSTPIIKEVKSGSTVDRPTTPVKTGFVFKSWCTDAAGNNPFDFGTAITGNLTLYAKWVAESDATAEIRFNLNGASGTAPAAQTKKIGDLIEKPEAPVWEFMGDKRNYFDGWYTEANGGSKWNFDTDKVAGDMTLYAHWNAEDKYLSGTQAHPYVFMGYDDLKTFADKVNEGNNYDGKYFELGADIDITDSDWKGIGYVHVETKGDIPEITEAGTVPFKGSFDGRGYTVTLPGDILNGVFGAIGSNAEIKNINVKTTLADSTERIVFGGIANMNFGTISRCSADISAESKGGNAIQGVGGIVGSNIGLIENCHARVELYHGYNKNVEQGIGKKRGIRGIGGIAGYMQYGNIVGCTVKSGSTIESTKGSVAIGGIVGAIGSEQTMLTEYRGWPKVKGCIVERGVNLRNMSYEKDFVYVGGISAWCTEAEDCYVGANIEAAKAEWAGVIAPNYQGLWVGKPIENPVRNCVWYGDSIVAADGGNIDFGDTKSGRTPLNCYIGFKDDNYRSSNVDISKLGEVGYKTTESFKSGEVAYLLDGGEGDHRDVWTQDGENLPTLGTPSYYKLFCDIKKDDSGNSKVEVNKTTFGMRAEKDFIEYQAYAPLDKFSLKIMKNPGYTRIDKKGSKLTVSYELIAKANGTDISGSYGSYKPLGNAQLDIWFKKKTEVKAGVEAPAPENWSEGLGLGDGTEEKGTGSGKKGKSSVKGTGSSPIGKDEAGEKFVKGEENTEASNLLPEIVENNENPKDKRININSESGTSSKPAMEIPEIGSSTPDSKEAEGEEEVKQEEEEQISEPKIFEIIKKTVKENPVVAAASATVMIGMAGAGMFIRFRKFR